MAGFDDPAFYGDRWAAVYDDHHAWMDPGPAVEFLAGEGRVPDDAAIIEVSRHDAAEQRVTTQIITLDGRGMHLRPVALRYSWPGELDLMAGTAGLQLRERHGDWRRQPFTSASTGHVSVYQRPRPGHYPSRSRRRGS